MKRILIVLLVGIVLLGACACGQQPEEAEVSEQPSGTPVPTAEPVPEEPPIALVLAGESEYTQTVAAAAQPLAEAGGYRLSVYYSADAGAQLDDMYAAIGGGAKCIILMPIDMDNLQPVLDECDLLKLPVVNIMVPVNGLVRVLISPDYQFMGAQAAEAVDGLSLDAANVLTIEAVDSPFVTQLVHDGFSTASGELDNVTLAASVLAAGGDVYQKTKDALAADETLNCVFVIDEYLTPDVIRAVQEAGRAVAVVATGGGVEMQAAVEGGSVAASVFSSPYELAELACEYALMAADGNDAAIPQYAGLRTEVMDGQTVAQYKSTGYADVMLPPQQPETEENEAEQNETDEDGQDEGEQDEGEAVDE